jgi:Smr domain-containing protein
VSIIESLTKLVDPVAAREREAERERLRSQPRKTASGPPPTFECRVCGHLGPEPSFCPDCLAETMRPSDKTAPAAPGPTDDPPPVEIPIDGTLDLHTVRPADAAEILAEYMEACLERGIFEVRVVHGKGTGKLRRTVESCLGRSPLVAAFRPADETAGGWGATLVTLRR